MSRPIDKVLAKLPDARQRGSGWHARCPAHADDKPSLAIAESADGKVLLNCHAGCSAESVCSSVGLSLQDLMPSRNGKAKVVARYNYRDETDSLLAQKVRFAPKDFRQCRPDGNGGWVWNLKDVRRVLYRLPQLLAADPAKPVLLVEGEKDADRLAGLGFVATTNIDGAGKGKWRSEYNEALRGRWVMILPDNDTVGREHADAVAEQLRGVARRVDVVNLPNVEEHGDVSDWLDVPFLERGAEDVEKLLARCRRRRQPAVTRTDDPAKIVSAVELVRTHTALRPPIIDGLLRRGEVMNIIAASKVGKSWLAHSLAMSVANGATWLHRYAVTKGRVLLIDNELHPETLAYRINKVATAMGVRCDDVDVLSLRGRMMSYESLASAISTIAAGSYALVVVDAHYRMLPTMSENDNAEMMRVYNRLDEFAAKTRAGWVLIHHASKGDQSGKEITEVGSGAGSQSRAADTHLILRRHTEDGCYVLEAVTRSFPPPEPVTLRWDAPIWRPDNSLDPTQLATPKSAQQKRDDEAKKRELIESIRQEAQTISSLMTQHSLGRSRCERLVKQLVDEQAIESYAGSKAGNETTLYKSREW